MKLYSGSSALIKLELLRVIPHRSLTSKLLRRWTALEMLKRSDVHYLLPVCTLVFPAMSHIADHCPQQDMLATPPPLTAILGLLFVERSGPFYIHDHMNDLDLLHHTHILAIALTDLCEEMYNEDQAKKVEGIRTVRKIHHQLQSIESSIS